MVEFFTLTKNNSIIINYVNLILFKINFVIISFSPKFLVQAPPLHGMLVMAISLTFGRIVGEERKSLLLNLLQQRSWWEV